MGRGARTRSPARSHPDEPCRLRLAGARCSSGTSRRRISAGAVIAPPVPSDRGGLRAPGHLSSGLGPSPLRPQPGAWTGMSCSGLAGRGPAGDQPPPVTGHPGVDLGRRPVVLLGAGCARAALLDMTTHRGARLRLRSGAADASSWRSTGGAYFVVRARVPTPPCGPPTAACSAALRADGPLRGRPDDTGLGGSLRAVGARTVEVQPRRPPGGNRWWCGRDLWCCNTGGLALSGGTLARRRWIHASTR